MKKIDLIVILLVIILGSTACRHQDETTSWQLEGVARFSQAPTTSGIVKMAAFLPLDPLEMILNGPESNPVSNVINLGTTADVDTNFTLSLSPPQITTEYKSTEMFLLLWEDSNDNDLCDNDEDFSYAHSQAGDPVFKTENLDRRVWLDGAHWYYEPVVDFFEGTRCGWNQRDGDSYISIDNAVKSGAIITNAPDTYW